MNNEKPTEEIGLKSLKEIRKELFSDKFKDYFKKKFRNVIYDIERKRKKYLKLSTINLIIAIIISAIIVGYLSLKDIELPIAALTILIPTAYFVWLWPRNTYKKMAKNLILPELLKFIGDFKFCSVDITQNQVRSYVGDLKLFNSYNRYNSDDIISGSYKNINITIAEILLEYVSQNSKHTSVITIFDGLLVKFKSFKKFKSYTLISREKVNSQRRDDKVLLEDPEFNKYYNVYSKDQIEARYLITPAFMERLLEIRHDAEIGDVNISFEQGNVNIAINSCKDWFEIPIEEEATRISNYRIILLQITTILSLIDALKFDQNIGM